jgi:monoamine oxidase
MGSAALTALPAMRWGTDTATAAPAPLPRDVDVVVIGAGVAGIAAARKIAAAGRRVIVIEATGRIGGRCSTDTTTFDAPFDRGARWLHLPDLNPVAKLARPSGVELYPAPQGQKIRIGRRNARASETEDFLTTLVRVNRAIGDASRGRADVAADSVIPRDAGEWGLTASYLLGPYVTGKDLRETSAFDLGRAAERSSASFCRQGLGTLIAKLGESVPFLLSTPVTRIAWRDNGADVETAGGKVAARTVIVTVSTNVLNSNVIRFAPDLPRRITDAASKLTLGNVDRIALNLPGNPLGIQRDEVVIEKSEDNRTAILQGNVGGSSISLVDVGGSFGKSLAAQGEAAMTKFAIDWLSKLYTADVGNAVKGSAAMRWSAEPFVLGANSVASIGAQPSRKALMDPAGSLFFAGEAAHETMWGTVGGAWESGERAADAVLRRLSGVREPTAAPQKAPPKRQQRKQTQSSNTEPGNF